MLSDPEKRRNYDQFGDEKGPQGGGGFNPFGDIFSNFGFHFNTGGGGGGGGGQQRREQMPDVRIPVEATLEDLYNGRHFKVTQQRQQLCHHCRGTGANEPGDIKPCKECNGSGMKVRTVSRGPNFVQHMQTVCDACGGTGKTVTEKCHHCKGRKVETGQELLSVWIEKGMTDGSTISFPGQTDERAEWNTGSVVMYIKTLPHPRFTRNGDDLRTVVHVSLLDALVGFEMDIVHLDAHKVHIKRTEVTPPNHVLKVDGEGMPVHSTPSLHGDLYVEFVVDFPEKVTPDQAAEFKKLLAPKP